MRKRQRSSGKFSLYKRLLYDKRPTKNAACHFWYSHCFNSKMTFDKSFMKKATILKLFSNIYYIAKYYVLVTVASKVVVLGSVKFSEKVFFLCLVYVNLTYIRYLSFAVFRICANCCFIKVTQVSRLRKMDR